MVALPGIKRIASPKIETRRVAAVTDALRFCQRTPAASTGRVDYARDGRSHGRASVGLTGACGALAIAFAALVSAPALVSAQKADRIWSGCILLDDETDMDLAAALEALIDDQGDSGPNPINDRDDANIEVAFVVVYSLNNVHDGQPVGSSGFTGPIICTAPGFSIDSTSQTAEIENANILDAEDAFILRYDQDGIKKRICHTVASNTDCFTVESTGE